jgi:hypothetical protein
MSGRAGAVRFVGDDAGVYLPLPDDDGLICASLPHYY